MAAAESRCSVQGRIGLAAEIVQETGQAIALEIAAVSLIAQAIAVAAAPARVIGPVPIAEVALAPQIVPKALVNAPRVAVIAPRLPAAEAIAAAP